MFVLVMGFAASPPTIGGHEAMIRAAIAKFLAEGRSPAALKVVMLPSADGAPVLGKVMSAPAHHRMAMAAIMTNKLRQDFPGIEFMVSPLEILFGQCSGQPSYLINTLRLLYHDMEFLSRDDPRFAAELFLAPEDKLILLYGADALVTLPRWKSSKELEQLFRKKNIELWVMPRDGVDINADTNPFMSLCSWLPADSFAHQANISSSQIRQAIASSSVKDVSCFLAKHLQPEILRYIEKERLYL